VARALAEAGVASGDDLIVACSHGPDSLVLADILLDLRRVTLVYVDHGLRPEARAEGDAVVAFAAARGAPAMVVPAPVVRGRGDGGLEAAARRARYAALDAAADRVGARWIALAHTAGDQAETVLAGLLRGAGAAGLAGMAPARGRYLRPLIDVGRDEVAAWARARRLAPSHDAMNDDPRFLRVRLRQELLPALRRENPALDATLARTARAMRECLEAIDAAAGAIAARRDGQARRLAAAELALAPRAVAKRALAMQAAALGSSLEARHLEALLALAAGPPRGSRGLDLPGLSARREYGDLLLERAGARPTPPPPRVAIAGDRSAYEIRAWRAGDRMRPARLHGRSRKLQDLYTDAKVPTRQRREALVVVRKADGAIVWAQYLGPAVDAGVEVSLTGPDRPASFE
jgi:tRNA(Ile)-lysidine synthase